MLGFVMMVLLSCGTKQEQATETTKEEEQETIVELNAEQLKNADIIVGNPVEMDMHSTIKVNGVVDVPPQGMVSVSFPLGGYLKSSHLLPGMGVKKGEVIATLEDQSYVQLQQDYLMAKAKMEFLKHRSYSPERVE